MSILSGSTLTLYGTVGVSDDDGIAGFTSKDVRNALTEHGPGDLVLNLNSGGGHAIEGLAIHNALRAHNGRILIHVDALAASAASLLLMAGDEVVIRSGAMIMIHDPKANAFGTADEHRRLASNLDMLSEQFRNIYAARTGRSQKEIGEMMAAETWMDADDAIKNGFANRKGEAGSKALMAFDYGLYQNTPQTFLDGTTFMSTASTTTADKLWAHRFYASASHSGLAIDALTAIVDSSETAEAAKDALIAKMAATRNTGLPGPGSSAISLTGQTFDNPDFLAKTVEGAVYARMSGKPPEDASREFMGRSLLQIGELLMQARGEKVSWADRSSLASKILMSGASHSTSDFPNLLTSSGNRVLLDAYKAAESPLKALAKRKDAQDFRPISAIRLSEMPKLEKLEEGGEINYGTRAESVESFRVGTFAKMFTLTRQALINDDLGAFADSATGWGKAAATAEADELAALFLANSGNGVNLSDGAPLYGTARGNKATGANSVLGMASMSEARSALRKMVGLDGKTPLSIVPKHLVVGPDLETSGEQLLHELSATQVANVNPFAGKLSLHVEPRFVGFSWRLFADPADLPTIVIAYLSGVTGPVVTAHEGWTTLGMEFRAVLDFGCGIESAKGTYLSTGV